MARSASTVPGVKAYPLSDQLAMARERGWPLLMGVVNTTPDSFSDGGRFLSLDSALEQALRLASEGADIIDIGGESTRPAAAGVPLEEELRRVIPVIEAIRRHSPVPLSIDSSNPEVMRSAVAAGATLINDVRALRRPGALSCAATLGVSVVLMHMQGEPGTMQKKPCYKDVLAQVSEFLQQRVAACLEAGLDPGQLVLDPGFGFGKNLQHNLKLLANLDVLSAGGWPVLVGVSRKSMINTMLNRPGLAHNMEARMPASVALAVCAAQRGAAILRVHDVQATADALRVTAMVAACTERSNG